jgi:8-oxo-dGTP pyrophosphatase MutT (NUDIX family)
MNPARWSPSVTVAAIVCDGAAGPEGPRYLLVEEHTPEGLMLNNPAGHLEPGESPQQGVVREALEETARLFEPDTLVGVYLSRFVRPARQGRAAEDVTYVRFAYSGHVGDALPGRTLDTGIERTLWLTLDEVRASAARHRSPLVLRCIEDHAAGVRHPLGVVSTDESLRLPLVKRQG